jgi:hypothetical protein
MFAPPARSPRLCEDWAVTDTDTLRTAETRFQRAQLHSDIPELDGLLHPNLVFVGPDGTVGDKDADLEAHRSGLIHLDVLEPEDLVVRVSDGVGITVLTARLEGEFARQAFSARMIYTRSWAFGTDGWRVVAAHFAMIEPE